MNNIFSIISQLVIIGLLIAILVLVIMNYNNKSNSQFVSLSRSGSGCHANCKDFIEKTMNGQYFRFRQNFDHILTAVAHQDGCNGLTVNQVKTDFYPGNESDWTTNPQGDGWYKLVWNPSSDSCIRQVPR